jgi:hypothetical protein
MPARTQASEDKTYKLIADLDEIIAEIYTIKLLGKEFELKPITGLQLKELDLTCGKTLLVGKRISLGENVPYDEIVKTYFDFCHLIIPDLKISDLNQMTVKQVNELLKICFKYATQQELTEASNETGQKKNLLS